MTDQFNITIKSGDFTENPRKRIHTIKNPSNKSLPDLKVQLPIAYEGPEEKNGEIVYTPEHYFVSAISGCFFTTFSVVCSNSNFNYNSLEITSSGYVGTSTGEKIMEKIEQDVTLSIPSSMNKRKAERILEMTEKRCPLAKSVKSNIINNYKIVIE
ncbi:MAG: OsmC family peroxiredoxin [Promethearchaeota archaeon]|nr:MAG: OsmC family peroxiredoxin [Candidatus Lokiarchaeota archaeon]